MVLSVVAAVELLEFSSFSPQEMMMRLKQEIRKMFINFFIFVPLKNNYISTNKDETTLPILLAMSSNYFTWRDPECEELVGIILRKGKEGFFNINNIFL